MCIRDRLRRKNIKIEKEEINQSGISINREKYLVEKEGVEYTLPKKEFELLALLMNKAGTVYTRDVIMETIWGDEVVVGERTIDVHIRKLREKLGEDCIHTIKGVGYKFKN